ncbi:MAG: histidine phosphatase family protein [Cytophagaceae bacterium]|nr:histidine phosphatase family protein [Cytophagaceae bacterium]
MRKIHLLVFLLAGAMTFAQAQQPEAVTTIFLVRHAEKLNNTDESPLTEVGKARATALAKLLQDAGIQAVYSTKYVRTQETARPLAESRNVAAQTYEANDAAFTKLLLKKHKGRRVLVVGHSNTVPAMLNALTRKTSFVDLKADEFDALFVVTIPKTGAPAVLTLRYKP